MQYHSFRDTDITLTQYTRDSRELENRVDSLLVISRYVTLTPE